MNFRRSFEWLSTFELCNTLFIGNEHLLYPPSLSPSENLQKIHRVCCTKASKQTVYLVQKEQVSHFLWKVLWWLFVALSNGNLHNLAVLQRVTRVMSSFWWQTIYKSEDKVNFWFISMLSGSLTKRETSSHLNTNPDVWHPLGENGWGTFKIL